jgi:glycosyltransferase involved in cell wall biosynthesis
MEVNVSKIDLIRKNIHLYKIRESVDKLSHAISNEDELSIKGLVDEIGLDTLVELDAVLIAASVDMNVAVFLATLGIENTQKSAFYNGLLHVLLAMKSSGEDYADFDLIITKYYDHSLSNDYYKYLVRDFKNIEHYINYKQKKISHWRESGNWKKANELLIEIVDLFNGKPPRWVYAELAFSSHMQGNYTEAEKIAKYGLGSDAQIIAHQGELLTEEEIIANWVNPSENPTISIVCAAYNHERYIDDAIKGFLMQKTSHKYEIIIHDDASTDKTQELIKKWQQKYPKIIKVVLQAENQLSQGRRAFDVMLKKSLGQYIAVCEGDDYWIDPRKLQHQVDFLMENKEYSCFAHNYYFYDESKLVVKPWNSFTGNLALEARSLKAVKRILFVQSLVFRKYFSELPFERNFAEIGDKFLTSYLGVFGKCFYAQNYIGSVRRFNYFSMWTPLSQEAKDYKKLKTRFALVRLHERLGDFVAANDLLKKISTSKMDKEEKMKLDIASKKFQINELAKLGV